MLSVIIPFYNSIEYLPRCLASLKAQLLQHGEIEFILVDDGSTDGSGELCSDMTGSDPRFRLVTKENGGCMSSWMEGLKHVAGDYLGFVDADDHIEPDMFSGLYGIAKKYKPDIVMCNHTTVYKNGSVRIRKFHRTGLYAGDDIHLVHDKAFYDKDFKKWTNSRWDKIFKTRLFKDSAKYITKLSRHVEDRHIVPTCMLGVKSFYYTDSVYYHHMNLDGSASTIPSKDLYEILKNLYRMQSGIIEDKGMYEAQIDGLDRTVIKHIELLLYRNLRAQGKSKIKKDTIKDIISDEKFREVYTKYSGRFSMRDRVLLSTAYAAKSVLLVRMLSETMNLVFRMFYKNRVRYK